MEEVSISEEFLLESSCTQSVSETMEENDKAVQTDLKSIDIDQVTEQTESLKRKIYLQEKKIAELELALKNATSQISSFLSEEQKLMVCKVPCERKEWSQESIITGLKMRYVLGLRGYNYLRDTGYPLPSISTLNRRLQVISFDFGLITSLLPYMKKKVNVMGEKEKDCVLVFDEMSIAASLDFDKSKSCFVGHATLGKTEGPGNHLLVGLVRGLSTAWKQVIAHEVTGPSTSGPEMKTFVTGMVKFCHDVGLKPRAIVSDMGASNKALWNSLDIEVSRNVRKSAFRCDYTEDDIHVFVDVPHLLKNLRSALFKGDILLPEDVTQNEGLPSRLVCFQHVKLLWLLEHNEDHGTKTKLLHHLTEKHMFPNHFQVMKVNLAAEFFSVATASGLETAVRLKLISSDSLTTAWFIRIVRMWFEMMTARHRKESITTRNFSNKRLFLEDFIYIIQNIKIGNGWKPIQTGIILSTLFMLKLVEDCFNHGYTYVLTGRANQAVVENIFSILRQKAGKLPTALKCQQGIKLISVSQFLAETQNGNYMPERDTHLLQLVPGCKKPVQTGDQEICTLEINEDEDVSLSIPECNNMYFIAGSCIRTLSKSLCTLCKSVTVSSQAAAEANLPEATFLTTYQNCGGLTFVSTEVYKLLKIEEEMIQAQVKHLSYPQTSLSPKILFLMS